jgi:undecaprenyl-diphosphatase
VIHFFNDIDRAVFLFLNRDAANPVFDVVMPFITDKNNFNVLFVLIIVGLLIFGGKKGRLAVLLGLVIVTLSDQLSSAVIKPLVGRIRPCHPDFLIEGARYLIGTKTSFSFPSSHAANMASTATWFSYQYKRYTWIFVTIAVLVGYSRIYVGVHYPTDVLGGAIVGVLCAVIIIEIEKWIAKLWKKRIEKRQTGEEDAQEGESY